MDRDITQLLHDWRNGDGKALDELTPIVYAQLHQLAAQLFQRESPGHTLQPTALVNEAMQRLIRADVDWQDRNHFFAISARMMRRILVNHARSRSAAKRGKDAVHVTFNEDRLVGNAGSEIELLALDDALNRLESFDERKAMLVELHYFGGLTYAELADVVSIAESTVHQDLRTAKAWLRQNLA